MSVDASEATMPEAVDLSSTTAASGDTKVVEIDLDTAQASKALGNACFGQGDYEGALEHYSHALECCPEEHAAEYGAVYLGNRAACRFMLEQWTEVVADCTAALEKKEGYSKALIRRAKAYEKLDDTHAALADYKSVVELDPSDAQSAKQVARLDKVTKEKFEEQKEEMIGKLKDLGNGLLGKFGMSLDNFKTVQDPNTGSYSINFQQ
jgi:tetratricopeptide (TPR) repeat protein